MNAQTPEEKCRRKFLRLVPAMGMGALVFAGSAIGQDILLKEGDSDAAAIDYRSDAKMVDRSKFPKFTDGQNCRSCNLYFEEKGATTGACGIVFGKVVAAAGWCSSWEKKAG